MQGRAVTALSTACAHLAAAAQDPGGASPNVPRGNHLAYGHGSPARFLTRLDGRCREQPVLKPGKARGDGA
jgi:hypothetical protein